MFGKTTMGAAAVTMVLLFGTTEAHAQTPFASAETSATGENAAATAPAPPVVERRWYGHQTLLADGASLSLFGIAAVADSGATSGVFAASGVVSWTLAAPIVHFAHGHVGKGFADLGVRAGSVALGGAIGAIVGLAVYRAPPPRDDSIATGFVYPLAPSLGVAVAMYEGMAIGAGIGAVTAMIIDHGALAHEDVKKPGVQILPTAHATQGGFSAGVSGIF